MLEHIDHGAVEVGILQRRRGDEEATLGGGGAWKHATILPGNTSNPVAWKCAITYSHAFMVSVGVVGASGFTGAELLRIVASHPHFELAYATADSFAGTRAADLYPGLAGAYPQLVFEEFEIERAAELDVVFLGLPHEASLAMAPQLVGRVDCVVDLSAAYRLRDVAHYPPYYGFEHDQPSLLAQAVYGLPELHRTALPGAALIATPGCYVTAATLALRPLVEAGLIETSGVIVDAASGVTGAGRKSDYAHSFTTVDENLTAYGLLSHRHTPEMEQEIGAQLLFTPHLAPMNRGILATCYARAVAETSTADLLAALRERWRGEPFMVVTDGSPSTKATLGTNSVHVTARFDQRTGMIVAIAALDNLAKGASGGAVQAANVALGLPEAAGLARVGVAP
jgi:N-acetyl-gamma-glutamyl-phosphate reductase